LDKLLGKLGEAKTKIKDDGSVYVGGELWSARSDQPIPSGSPIKVIRREGFILVVEKLNPS
jgi:membrane-bound serine protease (ClpP class)